MFNEEINADDQILTNPKILVLHQSAGQQWVKNKIGTLLMHKKIIRD